MALEGMTEIQGWRGVRATEAVKEKGTLGGRKLKSSRRETGWKRRSGKAEVWLGTGAGIERESVKGDRAGVSI